MYYIPNPALRLARINGETACVPHGPLHANGCERRRAVSMRALLAERKPRCSWCGHNAAVADGFCLTCRDRRDRQEIFARLTDKLLHATNDHVLVDAIADLTAIERKYRR